MDHNRARWSTGPQDVSIEKEKKKLKLKILKRKFERPDRGACRRWRDGDCWTRVRRVGGIVGVDAIQYTCD